MEFNFIDQQVCENNNRHQLKWYYDENRIFPIKAI